MNFKKQTKAILRAVSDRLDSASASERIAFLHIGKCAGTQIAALAKQINERAGRTVIVKYKHHVSLADIDPEAPYFFPIRNPLSRFVSGFYSRKRLGWPRKKSGNWSAYEKLAFDEFEDANELAENLFGAGEHGASALGAIRSIRHSAKNQIDWFPLAGNFLRVRPPIWIIRQEHFEDDFQVFLKRADLDVQWHELHLEQDPTRRHANDYSSTPKLSETAVANLERWYRQDLEFYRICEDWMQTQSG